MNDFRSFALMVEHNIERMNQTGLRILKTKITGDELYALYLASFPEGTNPIYIKRTEHDCSCCKNFIRQIGNTIVMMSGGRVLTPWDNNEFVNDDHVAESLEGPYAVVAKKLHDALVDAAVDGIYLTNQKVYGHAFNFAEGGIKHFHFRAETPDKAFDVKPDAVKDVLSKTVESFRRGLTEFTLEAFDQALELIAEGLLYRGDENKSKLIEFRELLVKSKTAPRLDDYIYQMFETTKLADLHGKALGTLLKDLSEGMELERAISRWENVMAPASYQRPKALVTEKMVQEARATLEENGLLSAMDRRVATFDDLPPVTEPWVAYRSRPELGTADDDLFASVANKAQEHSGGRPISYEDFKEVLKDATGVQLFTAGNLARRLMTVVTAQHANAKKLFKWKNPFTWSYDGDLTDSIRERVKAAGGRIDADICFRLAWSNTDDLDLHVIEPNATICYASKISPVTGGQLDIDMNSPSSTKTRSPVENIFYPDARRLGDGTYTIVVHQYQARETVDVGFEMELEVKGERQLVSYPKAQASREAVRVANMRVVKGEIKLEMLLPFTPKITDLWSIKTNSFVPVTAIFSSPNHWSETGVGQKHTLITLAGCKNPNDTRGFYNEFLDSGLFVKHKKVMEIVGSKVRAKAIDSEQLSGIGVVEGLEAVFKVAGGDNAGIYRVKF